MFHSLPLSFKKRAWCAEGSKFSGSGVDVCLKVEARESGAGECGAGRQAMGDRGGKASRMKETWNPIPGSVSGAKGPKEEWAVRPTQLELPYYRWKLPSRASAQSSAGMTAWA